MVDNIVSHERAREAAIHESAAKRTLPFRAVVLEKAISCTLGDRQDAYGPPSDALFLAAEFIRLYKQSAGAKYCAAHDEAIALACLKLARIACSAVGHNDNYVDGAAYFAIAAECQHLYAPPAEIAPVMDAGRLAEFDRKYKAAAALKPESNMLNPYAPANKKV